MLVTLVPALYPYYTILKNQYIYQIRHHYGYMRIMNIGNQFHNFFSTQVGNKERSWYCSSPSICYLLFSKFWRRMSFRLIYSRMINIDFESLFYQRCHCMESTLKPRKRRLKSDQGSFSDQHLVSIVAPSIELFNKIHEACSVLENFGIPYETTIVAAHRSPDKAVKYARLWRRVSFSDW